MPMRVLFWIVFLIPLIFGGLFYAGFVGVNLPVVGSLVFYVLIGLLGWKTFGQAVEG